MQRYKKISLITLICIISIILVISPVNGLSILYGDTEIQGTVVEQPQGHPNSGTYQTNYVKLRIDSIIRSGGAVAVGQIVKAHTISYNPISDFQVNDKVEASGYMQNGELWCEEGGPKADQNDQFFIWWAESATDPTNPVIYADITSLSMNLNEEKSIKLTLKNNNPTFRRSLLKNNIFHTTYRAERRFSPTQGSY